jgi:hypothetical protein
MQFLVITRQRTPAPPEMLMPMLGAMEAWVAQNRASGKAKAIWGFAGAIGGGRQGRPARSGTDLSPS